MKKKGFPLRMTPELIGAIRTVAERRKVSMNKLITDAVVSFDREVFEEYLKLRHVRPPAKESG